MAKAKTVASTSVAMPPTAPTTTSSRVRAPTNATLKTPTASVLCPRSSLLTLDEIARRHEQSRKRAHFSTGKGGDVPGENLPKRSRADTPPSAVAERVAPVGTDAAASVGLLAKASELLLHLSQLVVAYDKDVRTRENELSEARKANAALQSRLGGLVERNKVLESDALSAKRSEEELSIKLAEVESARATDGEEIATLKRQLDFAYDHQDTRVDEAVARAREEMTRGFDG